MPDIVPPVRPVRTQVGLILAKVETTNNVDALPTIAADAFLVENINYQVTPQVLRRNPQRRSLGNFRYRTGRKTATVTFRHEVKGSGCDNDDAKFATLLRGCGFALTTVPNTTSGVLQAPFIIGGECASAAALAATWAKTANVTAGKGYGRYRISVILGGASATAKMRVSGNPMDLDNTILSSEDFRATVMSENPTTTMVFAPDGSGGGTYTVAGTPKAGDILVAVIGGISFYYKLSGSDTPTTAAAALAAIIAADARFAGTANVAGVITLTLATPAVAGVVITSGTTAVAMGASGATYTPTWTGSLAATDGWHVDLFRPGLHATPVTDGQETMTIYVYRDGNFHKVTACMGSCRITGRAGEYIQGEFTFMGQYIDATEATFPTTGVHFEQSDPFQWERAQVVMGDYSDLPVDQLTVNLQNTVTMRPNASFPDGYNGFIITARDFNAEISPEAIGEAKWAQWRHFVNADVMTFGLRIGNGVLNNTVYIMSNTSQLTANNYQDQNTLQYYQTTLSFSTEQTNGDDEIRLVFA